MSHAPHQMVTTVQYGDTDASGMGHYQKMLRWIEEAELSFMQALGMALPELYGRVGCPRRRLEVDYLAPVHFLDRLTVEIGQIHVGRTSYTLAIRIVKADGKTAVSARVVIVVVDPVTFQPTPLPLDLAQALERAPWPEAAPSEFGA